MRTILLLLTFTSLSAMATTPAYRVVLKTKYDKTWYRITQDGKKWICATKHVPYFEAKGNPVEGLDWKVLEKESATRSKKCTKRVGIEHGEKRLVTCLDQKATMSLYKRVTELCRAKI